MKKILLFLLIGGGLLMAASCTKRYDTVIPNQTVYKDIAPAAWTSADTNKTYTTVIPAGALGSFGQGQDGVLIYFTFDGGKTYEQIPEVYNNISFTYTITAGEIVLYAQSANGAQTITPPIALTAKIVLVPSN